MDQLLLKFANQLDDIGYYRDAQVIDTQIRLCARTRRRPNYTNIAKLLTPIVATMLYAYINTHQPAPVKQKTVHPAPQVSVAPTIQKGNVGDFTKFLDKVEGGVSNRKKKFDPGGLTNRGITQKVYNTYRKQHNLKPQSVKLISDAERNEIIKSKYWGKGNYLPNATALAVADWVFHGGPAVKTLQKLLKIPVTGVMDKDTVMAVWAFTKHDQNKDELLAQKLISARQKYLESLKTTRKKQKVPLINYNKGWYNRLNALKDEIND